MSRYAAYLQDLLDLVIREAPVRVGLAEPPERPISGELAPPLSFKDDGDRTRLPPSELAIVKRALEGIAFGRPPRPEMGDLALPAFALAKLLQRPPKEVADTWAARLQRSLASSVHAPDPIARSLAGSAPPRDPEDPWTALVIPLVAVTTAGPYLNFELDPAALARVIVSDIAARGSSYGRLPAPPVLDPETGEARAPRVMVEYSSPNTNKPLHLGHIRNNLIGMSLSNVLEAAGHEVIRVNLVNDRGVHICRSMLAYLRFGEGETPATTGEKGDHFVGRYYVLFDRKLKEERTGFALERGVDLSRFSKEARAGKSKEELAALDRELEAFDEEFEAQSALQCEVREMLRAWEAGDPDVLALWRTMNEWVYAGFRETYERMGARFDRWYFESETWMLGKSEVERGLALGVFERRADGSVWAKLESVGLQDKVLLRSDGTSIYITQDLGTAVKKFEDYKMDRSIYVVGSEQIAHFQNLFAMLKLLRLPWADGCHHASYGLVTLPRGLGRLKSREGKAVDADDLLDELHELARQRIVEGGYCEADTDVERIAEEIGQGALKLYLLQVSSEKSIQFDPNETIAFTGDTGPAVQYSHARIQGILRKGMEQGKVLPGELAPAGPQDPLPGAVVSGPFLRAERVDAAFLVEPEERDVLRLLADYPQIVQLAARQLSAAPLANYLLDLTKAYARMYHEHEVLRAEKDAVLRARLQLALGVAQVLRNGLGLLAIAAPARM